MSRLTKIIVFVTRNNITLTRTLAVALALTRALTMARAAPSPSATPTLTLLLMAVQSEVHPRTRADCKSGSHHCGAYTGGAAALAH